MGIISGAIAGATGGAEAVGAWVTKRMAGGSYGSTTAATQDKHVTWQAILGGLVGTYGVIKNYDLQKRMVDYAKRGVEQADEYLTLSKRHYDEIILPAFTRTRAHFDFVINGWRSKLTTYINEGMSKREYIADYETQQGRYMTVVQAEIDKARRMRERMRGKFATGRAAYENIMFSIRGAEARVAAVNAGFRYEDAKKQDLDKWYWTRWSNAAELIGAAIANAISGLNQGAAQATTSLSAVGAATTVAGNAQTRLNTAVGESRDFWGGLSNSAFDFAIRGPDVGRPQKLLSPDSSVNSAQATSYAGTVMQINKEGGPA